MTIRHCVALVTGANRGLGLAFARELLSRGAKTVYAAARRPETITLPGVIPVELDVTRVDAVRRLAQELTGVSLVVNNAGILEVGSPIDPEGLDSLRRQWETNVWGVAAVSQAFAPSLIAQKGGLLNVVSIGSWLANPAVGNYAASKAGAWGLTNNLRAVLAPQGVTVTSLHMSYVDTDMTRTLDVPKARPEDIVRAALDGLEAGAAEVLADEASRGVKQALSSPRAPYLGAL